MRSHSGKTLIKIAAISLIMLVIVGYSYFQARNLLYGPVVALEYPHNGATVTEPLVTVKGTAKNISFISLNDRQIFVDKEGLFSETLLLSPGYNVWEIEAKDKFGRVVSKKIELVFKKNL